MLVLNEDPKGQLGPSGEVPRGDVQLVGAHHDEQLVEQSRRAMVCEGAEQQVETRQVVAVVPAADFQRQQGAEPWVSGSVSAHALLPTRQPRVRRCGS
jgi:hypothetical protein